MENKEWSGDDLFGARCGLLHSLSYESELLVKGKARKVIYAWGDYKVRGLANITQAFGRDDVVLHLNDLSHGFRKGMEAFLKDIVKDDERLEIIVNCASKMFSDVQLPKEIREIFER